MSPTQPPRPLAPARDATGPTRPASGGTAPAMAARTAPQIRNISPKMLELGRGFLSALFMGVRTSQIHDAHNRAFDRAVEGVRTAGDALYAASGGFTINFVEDSAFLNGVRLRFEGGAFDSMRALRHILESRDLGGIEMRVPPSYEAVRKLLLLFSTSEASFDEALVQDDVLASQINLLKVQRFADQQRDGLKVDRRIFAVRSYAKLLLALREQREQSKKLLHVGHPPKLRAVRVVQDLVELCGDRLDFLLRLGSNRSGAQVDELHAVNVCVISLAVGHAIGFARQDLVDVGVAGLFHDIGRSDGHEPPAPIQEAERLWTSATPLPYDGELHLAEGWENEIEGDFRLDDEDDDDGGVTDPLAAAGFTTLDETSTPFGQPVEYAGEIRPIDPSEVPGAGSAPDYASLPPPAEGLYLNATPLGDSDDVLVIPIGQPRRVPLAPGTADPYGIGDPAQGRREAPGQPGHPEEVIDCADHPHTGASLALLLPAGGLGRAGLTRAVVAAEHHALPAERYHWGDARPTAHLFSRIVAIADAYDALTSGLGADDGEPMHPLDALAFLQQDRSGRIDPRLFDALVNVLRAFPVGIEVLLDTGVRAVVASHAGGTRWDRPVVRTQADPPRSIDLMVRDNDRFRTRIIGTVQFAGDRRET